MNTKRSPYIFLAKITPVALIIEALPLPKIAIDIAPFIALLFFTYWLVTFNPKWQLFLALIIGVLVDVLNGYILGQNALALILSSVFIANIKQSFLMSNFSTRQVYIFITSGIYLSILLLVHIISIQSLDFSYYLLLTPLSSVLFWPVVYSLLSKCKH